MTSVGRVTTTHGTVLYITDIRTTYAENAQETSDIGTTTVRNLKRTRAGHQTGEEVETEPQTGQAHTTDRQEEQTVVTEDPEAKTDDQEVVTVDLTVETDDQRAERDRTGMDMAKCSKADYLNRMPARGQEARPLTRGLSPNRI